MTPGLPRVSFFFPAYGDEATVEPLARQALAVLGPLTSACEVIVVDDASPDRAGAIADRLAAEEPRVRVIHHGVNRGYGQALWSGLTAARYEWIAFTDGDLQYDPAELPRFLEAAARGADAVLGYKTRRAEGWRRALTSRAYNLALRALLDLPLRDADCAFKLVHRRLVDGFVPSTPYTEAFLMVELLYRARRRGARLVEVPVSHRPRTAGESRCFTLRTARRLAWYTLRGAVRGRLLGEWHRP